ncbi:PLP-dependent aminotransferase family protein [Rheinheimera sp.]|uniref:MocR-like pyridoxine biosynthesis transcription factor PdxR n=1 Tax=Rheinheimera sp. TaxID=1869214 RepID=UPI002735951F|nr:PLP-dependent aminotransferase family protein [Rheinheimera sp.]MDP2716624.1 PLP-dependent aminotransferase family protein [Rheinheimera sp.]
MRLVTDGLQLSGKSSLRRQLYLLLQQQLLTGRWPGGALLPSGRVLAADLRLSRNTVNQVLQQLVAEGYIEGLPGKGYRVAVLPEHYFHSEAAGISAQPELATQQYALPDKTGTVTGLLQPGVSALQQFPYAIWQRMLQRHCQRTALSGFADPLGYLPLRQALVQYLRQARQVVCDEQTILITAGAQQALFVAAKLVARAGQQVLMESPGYPRLKQALQLCELDVQHIAAGTEQGLALAQLPDSIAAKALFLTPGHQYPLGGIMPLPNRLALLDWARQHGVWLVEDDYDSEYQYRHRPIASLQGLAGGEGVLFVGSFSKTLFPGLRLGYLVAPKQVIRQAAAIVQAVHGDVPLLTQAALADFISEGHFGRHLRKMRRHYQQNKQLAIQLLQQQLPQCRLHAKDAGLHLVLEFPHAVDETALQQQLAQQQFKVQPLSRYMFSGEHRYGLVLGIANSSQPELATALQQLIVLCRQALAQAVLPV